jgi:uroporphyrin-III C-methyltransferase
MKPIFDKPIPLPRLTLVGAGPGDADLITVKGLKALQSADVVLYDALVAPELLDDCKPTAEKIYVGKRAGNHEFTQDQINDLIVEKAFERGHVVRLKGGDPFVFGRGYEEIAFAKRFGIGTAYVPGISSVQGATGYEDIPLTARGVSDSFWVLTGTKTDGSLTQDLQKAVQTSATVVILMGMNKLAQIAQVYEENGAGEIPAAIIQNGTRPDARIGTGTAKDLVAIAEKNQLKNPAVIVLGEVVKLRNFERKPVFEQMFV